MFSLRGATVGGGPLLQFPNDLVRDAANRQLSHRGTSNEGAVIAGILPLLGFARKPGEAAAGLTSLNGRR